MNIDAEALFVDGENVSRLDIACVTDASSHIPRRYIYQTDAAAKRSGYPGFEHVIIQRIGKESVDKAIAMDIVHAWHTGVRKIAVMSNDYDYGATALHLKARHPEMQVTLICDESKVSAQYLRALRRHRVRIEPLTTNVQLDEFACSVIEAIHELARRNQLNLPMLGMELKRRGIEYKNLKRELVQHKVVAPKSADDIKLSLIAQKHLEEVRRQTKIARSKP